MTQFEDAPWGLPSQKEEQARKENQRMAKIFLEELKERPGEYRRTPRHLEDAVMLVALDSNDTANARGDEAFEWVSGRELGRDYLYIKYDG